MKKAFRGIVILSLIMFPVLYILTYITDKGMRHSRLPVFAAWNDIYNSKINAEMIFLGTSRTNVMVSPAIIDSMLLVNTYNLGMDGWDFNMSYTRFRIFMQHNKKPKYILQNIDLYTFKRNEELYYYEQFIPYLNDPLVLNVTKQYYGSFKPTELYFPYFKYNGHCDLMWEGITQYFKPKLQHGKDLKGYNPQTKGWDGSFNDFKKANPHGVDPVIDTALVSEFEEYLKYCQANNIQVIFEYAPVYYEEMAMEKNPERVLGIHKAFAQKYNIPFLDYSHDTLCNNMKYFYNSQHLNKTGAEIFSTKLANDLKSIVK